MAIDLNIRMVPGRFNGRKALVTGGLGAIGRAVADRLAAEGASIVIWDRDAEGGKRFLAEADAAGYNVCFTVVDITDPSAIAGAVEALLLDGAPDIIINNAGGALDRDYSLLGQSDADWQQTFDINVMSTARVTRGLVGAMKERKYGRIVNIGSKAGRYGSYIDGPSYVAAKGAVHALTLSFAMEFGPYGITSNAVAPGIVLSERVRILWESRRSSEEREAIRKAIPLQKHGEPQHVAGAVSFLASDDAAFITGMIVDVNGGQSIST
jgi:NAD(P)-dependent dehydrogenase (short-subunit alcohol dehydrogenase family)